MKHSRFILVLLALASPLLLNAAREFDKQTLQLNVGPEFNYAQYEFGCLPKTQGYLAGIHFDFTYSKNFYTQLQFDGRWNAGPVCGCFDVKNKIKDFRPEFYFGYNFCVSDSYGMIVRPLIGFSFTYLYYQLFPEVTTYKYFIGDIPLGLDFVWSVREDEFDIGLRAVYRANAYHKVKLKMPCLDICDKVDLKRGNAVHVEMPFTWFKTWDRRANFVFKVVPFFDWAKYGRANEANCNGICYDIPSLKRWYLGTRLDFGLKF